MMQTDCMKELSSVSSYCNVRSHSAYMFPPSNLICNVTTASPIQTIEKTPEKTRSVCALLARIDRNKLSSRQKINGPLKMVSGQRNLG